MPQTAATFVPPTAAAQVSSLAPTTPVTTPATIASEAVRMVERVSAAADKIATNPAGQVTVRIDLDATHHVDVHVAMRGGQVHADFRNASPEMQAALSSAWSDFARSREGSNQRWAEPMFSAQTVAATSSSQQNSSFGSQNPSSGSSSFGPGQDSPKRESSDRGTAPSTVASPLRAPSSVSPVASPAPSASRADSTSHLRVIA
jgi:uncharacterized protein (DUF4415 family)